MVVSSAAKFPRQPRLTEPRCILTKYPRTPLEVIEAGSSDSIESEHWRLKVDRNGLAGPVVALLAEDAVFLDSMINFRWIQLNSTPRS